MKRRREMKRSKGDVLKKLINDIGGELTYHGQRDFVR